MAILEVKGLKKHFGETDVLKGVSFSLEQGQVLAIIGSSGSGKTTLLRCLNFLETADEGEVLVDGRCLTGHQLTEGEIRQNRLHFGLVFQNFNLFPQYTVLENITLAPKLLKQGTERENRDKALALLDKVGLRQKKDAYPHQLSGGQQQRVAIARALALNPQILCFDEPTSALDPELTGEVLRVIRGLKDKNNTMIVVTHEMEFAKSVADVVIYMADGVIEEMGTPEEVFDHPKSEKTRAFIGGVQQAFYARKTRGRTPAAPTGGAFYGAGRKAGADSGSVRALGRDYQSGGHPRPAGGSVYSKGNGEYGRTLLRGPAPAGGEYL